MPKRFAENFYFLNSRIVQRVITLGVKLLVDGEEIDLNEFVSKILSGVVVGAVTSLRGIKKEWKNIEIKVSK